MRPRRPQGSRLPFELADLRLLSSEDAKATLARFEWLAEFLMHSPGTATPEGGRLLLESIEVLQEIVNDENENQFRDRANAAARPETERAVLAAILMGHKSALELLDHLRPEYFFIPHNRRIFQTAKDQDEAKNPYDQLSVYEVLDRQANWQMRAESAIWPKSRRTITESSHVKHYATILRDKSLRRNLVHAAVRFKSTRSRAPTL